MPGYSSNNTSILNNSEVVKFTPKEQLFKYLSYLPYFIISLAICIVMGVLYVRYAKPVYKATTKVFVKSGDDNTASRSGNGNDLIDNALFGGKQVNIDNEIALLNSRTLLQRIVEKKQFNIGYFNEGNIKKSELYTDAPFIFQPQFIPDSSAVFLFYIRSANVDGGVIQLNNSKINYPFKWGEEVQINKYRFVLYAKPFLQSVTPAMFPFYVEWKPVSKCVTDIQTALQITPYGFKTTIIQLEMQAANAIKAADILDALVVEYKNVNIEDKNKVTENTIRFINQRLLIVTQELSGVETDLEKYRDRENVIDVPAQSQQFFESTNSLESNLTTLEVKQKVTDMLFSYLSNPSEKNALIPSNLGIEDLTLTALIQKYNELQITKERQAPNLAKNSLVLADLDNQLTEVRKNLLESINNIKKTFATQHVELETKKRRYESSLGEVPKKERALQEIKRQQSVKEGLYLYLLQKREEAAITSSSTISNYKQIDKAEASVAPIEPDKKRVRMLSVIIGLILPVALIYIIDIFNDKIRNRDDITKRTQTPIVGEVGHVDQQHALVVADKSRSVIAEQFRILRTNLSFLLKENKTMLITSSISGEGKSFISLNLAAVLAISGKKVALLEFDLRRPKIIESIGIEKKEVGITNYLIGQIDNPEILYTQLEKYPSLHVFGSGPVPPNPAELILGDKLPKLFEWLKNNYDYIIIDSAPVGLVGDSFTLSPYSDAVLYIIRQRYTLKKQIDFVNEIYTAQRFKNMGLVVNDVKIGGRYGYYGYGQSYGSYYGYYGQGNHYFDQPKKQWWKKKSRK